MAKTAVMGLYEDANYAAEAGDALQKVGLTNEDYDFLTGRSVSRGRLPVKGRPATVSTSFPS